MTTEEKLKVAIEGLIIYAQCSNWDGGEFLCTGGGNEVALIALATIDVPLPDLDSPASKHKG